MEAATLATALLNKSARVKLEIEPLRVQLEGAKGQLQKLMEETAGWKKSTRKACLKGVEHARRAKIMEVLWVVQRNAAEKASAKLVATRLELEVERHNVISLEFRLAWKQRSWKRPRKFAPPPMEGRMRLWSEMKICEANRSRRRKKQIRRSLSWRRRWRWRVGYPDLCKAAVEQFKESAEFQIAIDAAVAKSVAREGDMGAGPSGVATRSKSEEKVIQGFQWSDIYKYEMTEFWDSDWKTFKHKVEELFPDLDSSQVKIDEDDVAQTPLDEGIKEEDLASNDDE
ncbi:hypothetical protein CsSME_00014351 [Camellia sinensis var. sinensis]